MNPSASGWIEKYGSLVLGNPSADYDFDALYRNWKQTGFVYGINTAIPKFISPKHPLSEDEKAKINLVDALYMTYVIVSRKGNSQAGNSKTLDAQTEGRQTRGPGMESPKTVSSRPGSSQTYGPKIADFDAFVKHVFQFYKDLKVSNSSFLHSILTGNKTSAQLEKLVGSRVYIADDLISKTFNRIITNSLLFIDVLLFKRYLNRPDDIRLYAQLLEYLAINITYHALNSKEKNRSDERLAQLFAASLTFIDSERESFDGSYRKKLWEERSLWENQYFLDIACMTVWEDKSLEYRESEFIFGLGADLGFRRAHIAESLEDVTTFFDKNSDHIPFLKDSNPAVQFYDGMAKVVDKLILRNSKRLQKELSESKELMLLLSKSTIRDLTSEEKKKVQNQLMDVFKSIPSLAIFLLPGGAVLLPIFIKLIPKLLPSSFDENRVEK